MAEQLSKDPGADEGRATHLLIRAASGDSTARQELLPLIYDELRGLAAGYLNRERAGHTLQPTALVHEAYLRLIGPAGDQGSNGGSRFANRAHFMAAAAAAMRHVLVDHARRRTAHKRGGNASRVTLEGPGGVEVAAQRRDMEVLELDDLLRRLSQLDPRRSRVVELKFFAGMTNEEVAEVLGISRWTVADDWTVARAWMAAECSGA